MEQELQEYKAENWSRRTQKQTATFFRFSLRCLFGVVALIALCLAYLHDRMKPIERVITHDVSDFGTNKSFQMIEVADAKDTSLSIDAASTRHFRAGDLPEELRSKVGKQFVDPMRKDVYIDRAPMGNWDEVRCYRNGAIWRFIRESTAMGAPGIPPEIEAWAANTLYTRYYPEDAPVNSGNWEYGFLGLSSARSEIPTSFGTYLAVRWPRIREKKILIPDDILTALPKVTKQKGKL